MLRFKACWQPLVFLFLFFGTTDLTAQIYDPVSWKFSQNRISQTETELLFEATIEDKWHLYAVKLESDMGPVATAFYFDEDSLQSFALKGEIVEPKPKVQYDPNFMMNLSYFEKKVVFKQIVTVLADEDFQIKGFVEYMVCDDEKCLPPTESEFSISVQGLKSNIILGESSANQGEGGSGGFYVVNDFFKKLIPDLPEVDLENPIGDCGEVQNINNIWLVFLFGFLGGLVALLTPCVFPMIPLTVSFFTKGSDSGKGIVRAITYGFFIFLIYAILSIPFHFGTDPEALNEIATSVWLNLLFFIVFVVFAISFFGYFELTLPTGWLNKTDKASEVGGIVGIFFMALTLALVSFSCTGPILGTVLGSSLKNGPWPITAAMSGFGIALGLPFALFAAFPSVLNKLPKSGGWLNTVKVTLGFIELGLAVKFLSNADLVKQWGLIPRETFFLIWILIGIGLVLYFLGVIRFPHDSPIKNKWSPARLGFIALLVAFVVYLLPGVTKKPIWNHDLLSGFPPPLFYSWYDNESFHAEFMDFGPAFDKAVEEGKPVLIDFTGYACVNCRKMEESVWTVDTVKAVMESRFVLVSLYVDDKVELPDSLRGFVEQERDGEKIQKRVRTIGNRWSTFQTHYFRNNSQPYYVMISPEGQLIGNPIGYTPDTKEYLGWLNCGLDAYSAKKESASN